MIYKLILYHHHYLSTNLIQYLTKLHIKCPHFQLEENLYHKLLSQKIEFPFLKIY
jgi:hypothetical protein